MKNILILIDIITNDLDQNVIKNIKKKLKYFYYKLPYLFENHNITKTDLYFLNNNKYYDKTENKYLYYYLIKNTYESKKKDNEFEIKTYDIIIFINNSLTFEDKNKIILDKCEKVFLFNLLSVKYEAFERYNYLSKETIDNFTNYYNLETFNYEFDKQLNENNEYLYIQYIEDPKVKQHYDYYNEIEKLKIKNNEIIKIGKITEKNIKININKKDNKEIKEILIEDYDDNSTEYFKSNVSLSNYKEEMEENSFMGIMIQCDKDIFSLIFIPI